MNFTQFFYQVQSLIKEDNDIELLKIIKNTDAEVKEEFHSYYEDLVHCTYPNSLKCLYVLVNEVNKRYNIHSVFSQAFKDNNLEFMSLFLDTFHKKKNEFNQVDTIDHKIINNNIFSIRMSIDYFDLFNSSLDMWNLMFQHHDCNLFNPHMIVDEIFEHNQLDKLPIIDMLCDKYQIELPIKNIISNAFAHNNLDLVSHYLEKYQPVYDKNDITDLLNAIALTGNKENFQYFEKHFLSFKDFNKEQISLCFNAGLIVNKIDIINYLKDTYNIDFYPQDKKLKNDFINCRYTMWEDNNEKTPAILDLIKNVNTLFELYNWDKNELLEEIQHFSEIKKMFDNLLLNNKLNSKLAVKHISSSKGKI